MLTILIVGDKEWCDYDELQNTLLAATKDEKQVVIVHGGRDGLDRMAESIAIAKKWQTETFACDWELNADKKIALRNKRMVFETLPNVAVVCRVGGKETFATKAAHAVIKHFRGTLYSSLKKIYVLDTNKRQEKDASWVDDSSCTG